MALRGLPESSQLVSEWIEAPTCAFTSVNNNTIPKLSWSYTGSHAKHAAYRPGISVLGQGSGWRVNLHPTPSSFWITITQSQA